MTLHCEKIKRLTLLPAAHAILNNDESNGGTSSFVGSLSKNTSDFKSLATGTPRLRLSFSASKRPLIKVGLKWDFRSSTNGFSSLSSAAAAEEIHVASSVSGRSVVFTHSLKSCPTK